MIIKFIKKNYPIFILFIVLILFIILFNVYIQSNIQNEIPLNIFETWHTKDLPPKMKEVVDKIKEENPQFTYHLHDIEDCRNFIRDNFKNDVLDAYDKLIPLSYKSDLWRYCVLYKYGGIYLDIKFKPINNFKFISIVDKEHFTKDFETSGRGVCTCFIVSKPNNDKLLKAIEGIVENVKNIYYGNGTLEPTGPLHLRKFFTQEEYDNFEYEYIYDNGLFISKSNKKREDAIFEVYPEYREEQKQQGNKYHADYWFEHNIYNK